MTIDKDELLENIHILTERMNFINDKSNRIDFNQNLSAESYKIGDGGWLLSNTKFESDILELCKLLVVKAHKFEILRLKELVRLINENS